MFLFCIPTFCKATWCFPPVVVVKCQIKLDDCKNECGLSCDFWYQIIKKCKHCESATWSLYLIQCIDVFFTRKAKKYLFFLMHTFSNKQKIS